MQTLLDHASYGPPTEHDHSTVCWILESDLDEPTAIEVSDIHA
ncbi:MerR family transcriptional regulator [Mycobacterium tuberculosis]|nr:MerR family transcriptional regulator [Mycobacterium tuberculosis]